jgi:pentatricopeptide repeat protein
MSHANAVGNWNNNNVGGKNLINKFITAAKNGKLENVKNLFERMQKKGISVDSPMSEDDGYTALIAACENNHLEIVRFLVENGANVNSVRKDHYTLLFIACNNGNLDIIRFLVEHGADVNDTSTTVGVPVLTRACAKGDLEIVRFLVEHGANVNAITKSGGSSALIVACIKGHLELVRYLCQNGADSTLALDDGRRAIDIAEDPSIKTFLLEGCGSVKSPNGLQGNSSPLHSLGASSRRIAFSPQMVNARSGGRTRNRRRREKQSKRKTRK